jgi:hypothetical protein
MKRPAEIAVEDLPSQQLPKREHSDDILGLKNRLSEMTEKYYTVLKENQHLRELLEKYQSE